MKRNVRWTMLAVGLVAALGLFLFGSYESVRTWRTGAALQKLGRADEEEVPRVVALLGDYNPMIREAAAQALGRIGPVAQKDATPALLHAMHDPSGSVRSQAAWALGQLGPAAEAVAPLIEALDDDDPEVRRYAAFALSLFGRTAEPAVPKLIERLEDPHMAYMAARALGAIGKPAKPSIPHLIAALRKDRSLTRMAFTDALAKFGADAKDAVPDLLPLAQDPDADVRKSAAAALQSIDPDATKP